ncbi:hypothetical protein ACI6QG_14700 [Roseococcus sp. DSY-14]|uniref:hypothetical protein n=1 Tax=Roseococcus sp. DSY-14 TaxID=3369650 RepID=UPI00387A95C8
MDVVTAEQFLLDQVPARYRALFPPVLKNAYAAAMTLVRSEPMLQIPSAEDDRGRIVSWAVDKGVLGLIESGRWPVDFRWAPFAKPTGRYLQVRLTHSMLSISQVANPRVQPRNVQFRQNARLHNQPYFNLQEFEDARRVAGLPTFLLVHGYQNLEFAHFGVPHPLHKRDYIYRTPNLMLLPHEVPEEVPPVEQTDTEAVMTLKADIEKWRRDNGYDR